MRCIVGALLVAAGCGFTPGAGGDDGDDSDLPPMIDGPDSDSDAPAIDAPAVDAESIDAAVDATVDAGVDAAAAACPPAYVIDLGGSKYRLAPTGRNWGDAELDCEDDGAFTHLVVPGDDAELAVIDPLIDGSSWIGASDRVTEGTWRAVTGGAAPYLPWASGQPDDFIVEDCAEYLESGTLNDVTCFAVRPYVCECDGVPPDPSSY